MSKVMDKWMSHKKAEENVHVGQAVASMYQPKSHFNFSPKKRFW